MPITSPPTPPNSGNPSTFNDDADAFLGWFPTFVTDYNADAGSLLAKYRVTRSGSANAIVLTGGFTSLVTGTQVRFRAGSTNTGAATINLDGTGAIACRTITGVALPPGYIRTDVDTVATYDGTYWVLEREIERGSNANGRYTRLADGSLTCVRYFETASSVHLWTFPAGFYSSGSSYLTISATPFGGSAATASLDAPSSTGCTINCWNADGSTRATTLHATAIGYWY